MEQGKAKIKKVNILINVSGNTDAKKIARTVYELKEELERLGIIDSFSKGGVTADSRGEADE